MPVPSLEMHVSPAPFALFQRDLHVHIGRAAAASSMWRHQNRALIYTDISCRTASQLLMCFLVTYRKNIYQTAATPNLQNLVSPLLLYTAAVRAVYCTHW